MYNIKKRRKLEFFFPMAKALKTIVTKSCKDIRKFSQRTHCIIMKLKFIIIIALSISSNMAFAQEWNLTGRLFDKAAGSLPLEATEIIVSHLDGETISSGFSDN